MAVVRGAGPKDVPGLLPLVATYWDVEGLERFEPARVAAQLERLIGDPRLGAVLVVDGQYGPVGYLSLVWVFSLEHLGLTAEIDELFVSPDARGGGLGAALLDAAERGARRAACTNLSLRLARGNEPARALYSGHGFRARDGYTLMEKDL